MTWNWQLPDWPDYQFNINALADLERDFMQASGRFIGVFDCLSTQAQADMRVQLLSEEAEHTAAIEGEYLNRESLQASIRREMGLSAQKQHITAAEQGMAQVTLAAYQDYAADLDHDLLLSWHQMLVQGRHDLEFTGQYRAFSEPMQIISRGKREPIIHFEAPPSAQVPALMQQFLHWFNSSAPHGKASLPALARAGIAHLYFETIHPFEDGNGRIGRAVALKALSQSLGQASLIALSYVIEQDKKAYYKALQSTNHTLAIQDWLHYFAHTVLSAQAHTQKHIEFLIKKSQFFDAHNTQLSPRQQKVLLRMFKAGPDGFVGGLSAENYISITQTSRATATRDLQALCQIGALIKQGSLRYTRYHLNLAI